VKGIGQEGVPGLLTCLYSGDMYLIEAVVLVLGQIGDDRAIAHLVAVHENPNITETLRGLAKEAIERITGMRAEHMPPAKELFNDLGQRYYYRHPTIMRESRVTGYLLWEWSVEKNLPVWHEAPPSVYYDEMAEQACYDAITLDPDYEPPYALLASTYFQQVGVAGKLIAAAELGQDPHIDILQRNLDYLKERKAELDRRATLVTKAIGAKHLYRCLDRALRDDNDIVATQAMAMISEVGDGTLLPPKELDGSPVELPKEDNVVIGEDEVAEGTPLIRALDSSDERIRYAAANTLVDLNPLEPFLHCDRVVAVLSQALGEKAIWNALIVDADPQRQNRMKGLFPPEEFVVKCVPDPVLALGRTKEFPTPDLVLIGSNLPNLGAVKLVNDIKDDFRTINVPIYILTTADTQEDDEHTFKHLVSGLIMQREELSLTVNLIRKEFQKRWDESIKSEAETVALLAAQSLADIPVRSTVMTPMDALEILIKSTGERTDVIKLPCMQALAHLGQPEATEVLVSVFEKKENVLEVRLGAAEALAFCNPKAAYELLKESLNEEEKSVRELVAIAMGKAHIEGELLMQVLLEQRIGPPVSGTRKHEKQGIGDLFGKKEKVDEDLPTDPRGVVVGYIRALLNGKAEEWLKLRKKEYREEMADLKRRDPAGFRQAMAQTVADQAAAVKDSLVAEPVMQEEKAVVLVEKEKTRVTFDLVKEGDAWRIDGINIKHEL
jgi:HEAT repeat protein